MALDEVRRAARVVVIGDPATIKRGAARAALLLAARMA